MLLKNQTTLTSDVRGILFLLYSMLFLSTVYLALLTLNISYNEVKALEEIVYCEMAFYRQPTTLSYSGYTSYRLFIFASLAILTLLALLIPALKKALLQEIEELRISAKHVFRIAKQHLAKLTLTKWLLISAVFGAIAIVRLYFLLHYPLHTDETATFDYFVMEGVEAVAGYYPIPNNHVFQNILNWVSYQIYPDFIFSVRGTSFLVSFLGLFLLFILLYVIVNFWTAIAFALMIGSAYMPLYFSITGRGYALLLILAGIGFLSVYCILKPRTTSKNIYYFTFTISSILGLYTVPTYLYTFATYIIILLVASVLQKQYARLLLPAGIAAIVGLTTLVLYSPIIAISGSKALFGNTYIASQGSYTVLIGLKNYFIMLENSIVGQVRWGYLFSVGAILLTAWLIWADVLSPNKKLLCLMALTGILLPYIFFILQGVLPPERSVSFKAFYFFLMSAIIADTIFLRFFRNTRTASIAFGGLLLLYFMYEVSLSYRIMNRLQPEQDLRQAIWKQAMQYSPASMYITDSFYQLFYLHNSKLANKDIEFSSDFEEGKAYDILILNTDSNLSSSVLQNYLPLYQDDNLRVYRKRNN